MTEIDYISAKSEYKSDLVTAWSISFMAAVLLMAIGVHWSRGQCSMAVSMGWIPCWIIWNIPSYVRSIKKNKAKMVLWEVYNA